MVMAMVVVALVGYCCVVNVMMVVKVFEGFFFSVFLVFLVLKSSLLLV